MNPIVDFLVGPVLNAIEKYIPDPQQKAQAQIELLKLQQDAQFKELDAAVSMANSQTEVNKAEASSGNAYAASWRPTIGYIVACALGYYYVVHPLLQWALVLTHSALKAPDLVLDDHMWELILGMLGLGGMRTFEKIKGAA